MARGVKARAKRMRVKDWLYNTGQKRNETDRWMRTGTDGRGWRKWRVGNWFFLHEDTASWRSHIARWKRRHLMLGGINKARDVAWVWLTTYPSGSGWIDRERRSACSYCLRAMSVTVDHVHPKSKGGNNSPSNLIGSCQPCNTQKASMDLAIWLLAQRRLRDTLTV